MKKIVTILSVIAMSAPSAFGVDGGVTVSRALPTSNQTDNNTHTTKSTKTPGIAARTATINTNTVSQQNVSTRTNVQSLQNQDLSQKNTTIVRSAARVINNQKNTTVQDETSSPRSGTTISRSGSNTQKTNERNGLDAAVHTVGRNARVSEASINNNPAVRRAGLTLRPTTAEVGGRATIAGTDIQTGSNIGKEIRNISTRAAINQTPEAIKDAKERLEQTADLNKSCQEQYNECMDQFCAVVDQNQKRCSCSGNLSRYTRVETAVKDANTELNEVAQRIRYVGLSADEIRAIMNATEAELALDKNKDTSTTRNMLSEIESLIKDPTSSTSYSGDSSFGLDMDLSFSSDSADMFSLDFLSNNSASSISNLRGTELYNAAKKRCNTVLNQCVSVGATSKQITGNYDLAIDKDCIAYEQGLSKMNDSLLSNVRSANLMLQKARLALLENKNAYDAKGCIAALDNCMIDDMVCGEDYIKCLDPTKKYIDENGKVILGQNISNVINFTKKYDNSSINSEFLETSQKQTSETDDTGQLIIKYLLKKIGTGSKSTGTDSGLCRAVLDKCQRYTYVDDVYQAYNDVVVNYIQRALTNIRAEQRKIVSDYASICMTDVANCYNQQVTQVNTWSSTASTSSIYTVMTGACRNVALTCAYAVFANDRSSCPVKVKDQNDSNDDPDECIKSISKIFYQSLLCPENSTFSTGNKSCSCDFGFQMCGGKCVATCDFEKTLDKSSCTCVQK